MTKTDWSMIRDAVRDGEGESSTAAMEQLARRYWPAVYAYIRSTGADVHRAADITQGFVCDVIIGRRLFAVADPKRGRFRSLLLQALQNYMRQVRRYEQAGVRNPRPAGTAESPVTLDPEQMASVDAAESRQPNEAFAVQWSATLVRRVLEQVRQACLRDGLEPHWIVFENRVARPMLFGERPTAYSQLVRRLDLEDSSQAANLMVTVKRRFARALFREVSRTVSDPAEAEAELSELLQSLGSPANTTKESGGGKQRGDGEGSAMEERR